MLRLNSVKKIQSLKTKKGRDAEKLFLIEGKRSVEEYLLKSDLINEVLVSESEIKNYNSCLLYTSPSPRDGLLSRMPSSA